MARHPDWFERLDAVIEVVRQAPLIDCFGRAEIQAVFTLSERDSIRLLHKFGAARRDDALSLPRSALLAQLEAIRAGTSYAGFLRRRRDVAGQLSAARAEAGARRIPVKPVSAEQPRPRFEDLPNSVRLERPAAAAPGVFQVVYRDGADLMRQIADFLAAAGANRDEFFAATNPPDEAAR